MRTEGTLLINGLLELAQNRTHLSGSDLDRLKAMFLLVTSAAAETVGDVENISYGPFTRQHYPGEYSGLTIKGSGVPLTTAIAALLELDVEQTDVDLDRDTFRTAIRVVLAIVSSLEWSSFDPAHQYSMDKAERLISATISSLRSYRETGEP